MGNCALNSTASLAIEIPMPPAVSLDRVLAAIRTVRISQAGLQEFSIHDAVCDALTARGIAHRREHIFGERCRADIWVDGIVIEIKKQRPARASLLGQLGRYASKPTVRAIVAVMERSINLPASIEGKPVSVVSLNALWGIAL